MWTPSIMTCKGKRSKPCLGPESSIFQVAPGKPLEIDIRELSCYCQYCCIGNASCENKSYVGKWETKVLKKNITKRNETTERKAKSKKQQVTVCPTTPHPNRCQEEHRDAQNTQEPTDPAKFKVGDYVAVCVRGPKRSCVFMAKILGFDGDLVQVHFLKLQHGGSYVFTDVDNTTKGDILFLLDPPNCVLNQPHHIIPVGCKPI